MSRAALQASNVSTQNVADNGLISVGSIKLRYGRDIGVNEGSLIFKGCGYYAIDEMITVQPSAIGEVSVKLQHNGVDIPGAIAYGYATVANQSVTLNIQSIIRVVCDSCPCENLPDSVSLILVSGGSAVVVDVLAKAIKL